MIFTDTHAHLYASQFVADRNEMLERAINAGVSRLFLPNIDRESIPLMLELSDSYPENCFPMMGLHPCSVDAGFEKELELAESWLNKRAFTGIGEIGIDLHWDKTFAGQQKEAFRIQVQWAKVRKLPIVIHSRNAFRECFEIVAELHDENLRGVFHCFGDGLSEAQEVLSLGTFWLGIGGVLTYKNSGLDEVLKHIGMEKLVLETDSPYLAPVPHRGKRNESSYLVHIAQKVADVKQLPLAEVARITTENSVRLFSC